MGNFQAATLLVRAGANPNVLDHRFGISSRQTPLEMACESRATIQYERDVEWYLPKVHQTHDESEWDAARAELIEALRAAGASVGDGEMQIYLIRFCLSHSPRTASALLRLGLAVANPVTCNAVGQTPPLLRYLRLNSPAVCLPQNLVIIRLLLDHGARLDMPDFQGLDMLQLSINWSVENSKWSFHLRIVLEHAKDANVVKIV